MMNMPDASFFAAIVIGFLGGAHCIGMCGGIVSAMSISIKSLNKNKIILLNIFYNIGRILSYIFAGAVAGSFGLLLGKSMGVMPIILNILASFFIIALGFYIAGIVNMLRFTETLGDKIWLKIQPLANKLYPFTNVYQAISAGFVWGFIPCGMVYALLAWAVTSSSPILGAWYMLGFGIGTFPVLVAIGLFSQKLKSISRNKWLKLIAGGLIIAYGLFRLAKFLIKIMS